MKRLGLPFAVLVVAAMFATPLYAQGKASADQGKKVFADQKCGMCHTATRNSLADVGNKLTAEQIREWIQDPATAAQKSKSTAKPAMKSFKSLPQADVDALVAYLQTMKGGK